jgi:iron(III) transport system ATP-binding protein
MTSVQLRDITKRFGETLALDRISLEIAAGELFFLLGPSGCGKSTLLRLIAGLHEPDEGRIFFSGQDVTALGTEKRNAVMCFQSYALWPHMSVRENIRFGLGVRKLPRAESQRRIDEVLGLVRMAEYADRKPNQLSGGQQQRVALARAIAVRPAVLLLDEPLSNLDAKLRHEMRSEIRRICKESGLTTIYVTHDQKEALSVADRIAVLKDGRLMQIGTPGELYHRPNSAFVADFIGQTNLIPGRIVGHEEGLLRLETDLGVLLAAQSDEATERRSDGGVLLSIRPEQMQIARNSAAGAGGRRNRIVGKTRETTFLGEASEHTLEAGGRHIKVIAAPPLFEVPGELAVEFDAEDVVVLSA